ncbi:MAG: hydroxyacid dehydrogenase [Candidatus Wildermuthbacteria bacterium RIFCSPLOWO2_12_FULL_40_9]|uniref:Hydroxyacid dehydrogenase n=2 Tax=Candidatus Wildermuthiibacteriota TaxID=1817923 RepID=A0A1G2RET5_9BACT|nr:MAG: hydroxyacid dehydrogenase [Candidatus Wildermuthbacteria bacterium RIFCSPHIGHO2_12_FULL_40_12]OHA77078.1 MAG: hydroxyacid dehydrogenase [Candidatus Wildermuthbacteria bacterium RIFCSPLOWO2_12_FULL_40_9]
MKKLKIAFFETEPWEINYLKPRLKGLDLIFFEDKLTSRNLKKILDVDVLSPFIYSVVDKKVINSLESLKYIATRSTGFDHIDLKSCRRKNILVSNVPTYGENTVAEHTFALILALSRKVHLSWERTQKGNFSLDNLRGFDLKGKNLGVVGVGNIGRHVIRIAKGFDMNILAFDIKKDQKFAKEIGFKYVPLDYLFKNSDIITLHVPYNRATHHLVNLKTLKLFKKGCYLINTARGGICDTTALLKGLKQGIFAGLGLDVLEEECFIKEEIELLSTVFKRTCDLKTVLENHILINQPNVVITPHNAFNSKEALTRILDTTVESIKSFAKNKPINLVKYR